MTMTTQERENFIKYDNEKRKEIIKNALMIACSNKEDVTICTNIDKTRQYFKMNFSKYLGNILTNEKYKPCDFWFNDAGFQFKWRNFENNIQLECLDWNTVFKLIKELL